MLGIPYRVHQLQRMRRNEQRRDNLSRNVSLNSGEFRIFVSESNAGPPILMRRMSGWSFGSKVMAATAGFILVAGIILTLLTMNSSLLHLDAYRPVIFTILGILFIIIGPMVACRMVLNAYDRRLAREQRQFECLAQQIRRRQDGAVASLRSEGAQNSLARSRAQLAVDYLLDVAGVSNQRNRPDLEEWFPGKLPSYESALDLKENPHWSKKFFDYQDPPPPYHDVVEMDIIRVHGEPSERTDGQDLLSDPPSYPLIRQDTEDLDRTSSHYIADSSAEGHSEENLTTNEQ